MKVKETMEKQNQRHGERGSALLLAIVATVALAGLAGAMLAISGEFNQENVASTDGSRALYVAEAGLSDGIALVQNDSIQLNDPTAVFGAAGASVPFGGGGYWGSVAPDAVAGTFTVTAFAEVAGQSRGVEAVLGQNERRASTTAPCSRATPRGDALYDMKFGRPRDRRRTESTATSTAAETSASTGTPTIDGSIKRDRHDHRRQRRRPAPLPMPDLAGDELRGEQRLRRGRAVQELDVQVVEQPRGGSRLAAARDRARRTSSARTRATARRTR